MSNLKQYGSSPTLDIGGFPDCVDPEYIEAWAAYISTQTAQDLYNSAPQPKGMERVIRGFISSISSTSTKFLVRSITRPQNDSIAEATAVLKVIRKDLRFWLDRMHFMDEFRMADVRVTVNSTYNPIANCVNSTATAFLVYIPKPVRGKEVKIGSILHSKVPYWFKGKQPASLFKTDNLTKKLAKSAIPVVPDTYPSLEYVMAQPRLWHQWDSKLGVECIRIKGNALVLKISSPRLLLFCGRHRKSDLDRKLITLVRSTFV